jgi:hypothetical protein
VVEVCVRRLRMKLGEEAPIETVRHAGLAVSRSPGARSRSRTSPQWRCCRVGRRSPSTSSGSA